MAHRINSDFRIEKDSMGEVLVPKEKYWGAQTQRSFLNFEIGVEIMPLEVIYSLTKIKLAAARVNRTLRPEKMTELKILGIETAAEDILDGLLDSNFPLSVWQTGSGTQTNMNVNEVMATRANEFLKESLVHPNDDVNMSQSSNDVFPSAMHVAAITKINNTLFPARSHIRFT